VEQIAAPLPESGSSPWLCRALSEEGAAAMAHWLRIHRDADDPSAERDGLASGPAGTTEAELIRVCATRWQVEACFAQANGAVGMDQSEVRTWMAWDRFVTLCLLAHASLVVVRPAARCEEAAEQGALLPA
jgi:SRSO17 transposase